MKITDLVPNASNPRLIKDDKFKLLVKSIREFPAMMELRPIVIDEQNIIQGGNMRYKALIELGYEEIPDNWIKQGKDLTPEQWREFVIKDNVSFGIMDWDIIANEWDVDTVKGWGLDLPVFDLPEDETTKNNYSRKIEIPIYEPKNEKHEPNDLYDSGKYKELIQRIEKSDLPKDVKAFLKVAAGRHIVFNYSKIADYYAHSGKDIQNLMEDSALVIIDFDRSIELGFVKLSEDIAEQYLQEYGDK